MTTKTYDPVAIAAWSLYEFLRRLGLDNEHIGIAPQESRMPVGQVRVIVIQARAGEGPDERQFTLAIGAWPGDDASWRVAWKELANDVTAGVVPTIQLQTWLATMADGGHYGALVGGCLKRGVVTLEQLKTAGAEVEVVVQRAGTTMMGGTIEGNDRPQADARKAN